MLEEGVDPTEAKRWMVELVTLTHDILTLTPPTTPRNQPYEKSVQEHLDALPRSEGEAVPTEQARPSGPPKTAGLADWRPPGPDVVDARTLPDDELLATGWAYEFDYAELCDAWGKAVANEMRLVMSKAIEQLANQRQKGLQRGPFLVWALAQTPMMGAKGLHQEGVMYCVTPYYDKRLPANAASAEPLRKTMKSQRGYITTESCQPIRSGALPILLYQDGKVSPVAVNAAFVRQMAKLHEELFHRAPEENPYRLMRMRENGTAAEG